MTGNFEEGIRVLSHMFDVKGKVIPVTTGDIQLGVTLENGEKIIGETNIDCPKHDPDIAISDAFLIWDAALNPLAKEVLQNSDYIIIGPGDLYTSIVPNLLVNGMKDAIQASKAKIIYVCNIMTKHWETTGFYVEDFVRIIEKYIWANRVDFVVVNNGLIAEDLIKKYKKENKTPVVFQSRSENTHYKIIERDVVNERDYARHDPRKLARITRDFVDGWIK